VIANDGVIALGQVDDEIVNAGRLGGRNDGIGVRRILEAADILRHRTVEQFDILRHVADMPAERFGGPLIERRAIEPDVAAHRPPDSDQHARQRRLARCGRSDNAQSLAGSEREVDVLTDHFLHAWRRHRAVLNDQRTRRRL
jgi:hypothetical protein